VSNPVKTGHEEVKFGPIISKLCRSYFLS